MSSSTGVASRVKKLRQLAGRVGILELDPLTATESATGDRARDWRQVWLQGGFPDALRGSFREWCEAYLRTYVARGLPQLGVPADSILLRRLLTMVAHIQGGLLNASQLGNSLDVSYHTVQRYLNVLEQTFIIRRLPTYFRNIGKRLTKSPKIYLRDTGLLHHPLNINSLAELDHHPMRAASWETFVMEDLLRREKLRNPHTQFSSFASIPAACRSFAPCCLPCSKIAFENRKSLLKALYRRGDEPVDGVPILKRDFIPRIRRRSNSLTAERRP